MLGDLIGRKVKRQLADGLIGKFLKGAELQEGEDKAVLMLFEEQDTKTGNTVPLFTVCAVKIEAGSLKVVRVIESINVNEAL